MSKYCRGDELSGCWNPVIVFEQFFNQRMMICFVDEEKKKLANKRVKVLYTILNKEY